MIRMGLLSGKHVVQHTIVLIFAIGGIYRGMAEHDNIALTFGLISLVIGLTTIARYLGQQDVLRSQAEAAATTTKGN